MKMGPALTRQRREPWTYATDQNPFTGGPQGLFRFPTPVDRAPEYLNGRASGCRRRT
jgi:hypothetical protein